MDLQVGVKILIKNRSNQYLFLRRATQISTDSNEVSWDIPGGRISSDEPLLTALKREIEEEIGHSIIARPKLLAAQDMFVQPKNLHVVRLTYTIEEDVADIRLSNEHSDYQWVDANDIAGIAAEPFLEDVLKSLQAP